MKLKLTFLAGAAVGYVLGARAGRDSYEDMKRQADALWHDPRVQEKVATAGETVKEKAPDVGAKISEAVGTAAGTAKDKVAQVREGGNGSGRDLLIGEEKSSDYTPPRETKVQSR